MFQEKQAWDGRNSERDLRLTFISAAVLLLAHLLPLRAAWAGQSHGQHFSSHTASLGLRAVCTRENLLLSELLVLKRARDFGCRNHTGCLIAKP